MLALATASQGAAQETPLFSLGGGLSFPAGAVSDTHESGFNLGATATFPVAPRLEIEVSAHYVRLSPIRDLQLETLGFDPGSFEAAGGSIDGGYSWTGTLLAGGRFLLMPRSSRVVPNLHVTAGWASTGIADQSILFLSRSEDYPGFTENVAAVSLGAGVEVHLRNGVGLFGSVRHVTAFTDPERTTMIPVTLGLSLRLEER